jgi:acetyl esterase/lipase
MKRVLNILLLAALALSGCSLLPGGNYPTPNPYPDTFFAGRAFIDINGNNEIDPQDRPLAGARFVAGENSAETNTTGSAIITYPGVYDQPVPVHMEAPASGGYALIGPAEATLQLGQNTSADFLFAVTGPVPDPENGKKTEEGPEPTLDPSKVGGIKEDLTYCTTPEGVELKLDLIYPPNASGAVPLVVYVHGGDWTNGDKRGRLVNFISPPLLKRGIGVAAINYRLAPDNKFPAPIQDVKCAIRYLRASAAELNIDPERIGITGESAGGHLAALAALSDASSGWDTEQYKEQSSQVKASSILFAPTDLATFLSGEGKRRVITQIFGATGIDDPLLITFSPTSLVKAGAPPFLFIHGLQDTVVPIDQSQNLNDRLVAAGIASILVGIQNVGHDLTPAGGEASPTMEEIQEQIGAFFEQNLK